MTVGISDTFDNEFGFSNYGTTYDSEPPPASITSDRHVDVRIFDLTGITRPRVMNDLDGDLMSDLDGDLMSELEEVTVVPGEHFVVASGTGAVIDPTADANYPATTGVGKYTVYEGWRAMRLKCDGAALSLTVDSDWPTGGGTAIEVDLTVWDTFSVLIDQSHMAVPGKLTQVHVKFNNDPNGVFGGATDSGSYALSLSGSNWTGDIATMIGSPGGCDFSAITGVRFIFADDGASHPAANDLIYVLAMRAYTTGYVPGTAKVDVNTKRGSAIKAIPVDLANPAAPVAMIRGSEPGQASDPRPIDATTSLHIKLGDLKFSVTGTRNVANLYFREDFDTSSYVKLGLTFYGAGASITAFEKAATVTTVNTSTSINADWTPIVAGYQYIILEGTVKGTTYRIRIWGSDAGGSHRVVLYDSDQIEAGFNKHRGRVGWGGSWKDRDVSFFSFTGFGLAYSVLTTAPANSYQPVDGVQLTASFSQDDNLFSEFTGAPFPVVDTQRALSADGSFRGTGPMTSNSFYVTTDPDQSYLEFDLWVPSQVSVGNQPRVALRSPNESTPEVLIEALDLQGNQWNHIEIELGSTAMVTGVVYRVYIERSEGLGTTYEWNVDNMVIGVRNVRWSACADLTDIFIDFRDTVNDEAGGLHFPHGSRGTQLQIKAEALTEKAWVAPFSFKPRYAALGKPKYLP